MRHLEKAGVRTGDMAAHAGRLERTPTTYRLEQRLRISVRDLQRVAAALANALGGGADALDGLAYGLDDARAAGDRARERALLDARQKAEMLAQELELSLGRVLSIVESPGGVASPQALYGPPAPGSLASAPDALEVRCVLQVSFELLD
jgi:uncharacterized protein YggE